MFLRVPFTSLIQPLFQPSNNQALLTKCPAPSITASSSNTSINGCHAASHNPLLSKSILLVKTYFPDHDIAKNSSLVETAYSQDLHNQEHLL